MTTTTQLTLTDFLLARIAEDVTRAERAVRVLKDFPGQIKPGSVSVGGVEVYDARRAIREIEAKRRIVEMHSTNAPDFCDTCSQFNVTFDAVDAEPYPCSTLRTLAAVYADHPDYRREWRLSVPPIPTPNPNLGVTVDGNPARPL